MEKNEALNVVAQACAVYKGTLQDHQALQKALEVLKADVEAKPAAGATAAADAAGSGEPAGE